MNIFGNFSPVLVFIVDNGSLRLYGTRTVKKTPALPCLLTKGIAFRLFTVQTDMVPDTQEIIHILRVIWKDNTHFFLFLVLSFSVILSLRIFTATFGLYRTCVHRQFDSG